MQIRSESRDTVFNRQLTGKLDRRLIASLGYGNTQAFYTKETDQYNKLNLHISVDASASMRNGSKWERAITNVVALAKAADMITNLNIQISFRTVMDGAPYVIIAYDNRTDKFAKIKKMFPYLRAYGTTPEGLCFEAIKKNMVQTSNGLDSYFLNISDGEPYFISEDITYMGMQAAIHTSKIMESYKNMGIKILSYFISESDMYNPNSTESDVFRKSYGNDAKFINVTNANEVSKTMNKLFMSK
jgi:hypothetical protein